MSAKTFEASIETLEQIVHTLEKGQLTLDEALHQFETGVKLARHCETLLKQAEQKILKLQQNEKNHES